MKFHLNRKTIAICSLVLILFVIGYAYNQFTNSNFETLNLELEEDMAEGFGDYDVTATVVDNKEGSVSIIESSKEQENETEISSFFSEYRLERDKNRSKEYDMWQNIIESEKAEATFKNLAQQEIVKLVALTEKEMIIENLIIAKGFKDALVFLTDDSVTVLVGAKELTSANVAQIQDIVMTKTKIDAKNIKIMKKD